MLRSFFFQRRLSQTLRSVVDETIFPYVDRKTYRDFAWFHNLANNMLQKSVAWFAQHTGDFNFARFDSLSNQVNLWQARYNLSCETGLSQAQKLCMLLVESNTASSSILVWAYYYLGKIEMTCAKDKGSLISLWEGHSDTVLANNCLRQRSGVCPERESCEHLSAAREYFLASLAHIRYATDVLMRNILRSLALVTGPENGASITGVSSCALILTSIGSVARQQVLHGISEHKASTAHSDLLDAFEAFDYPFGDLEKRNQKIKAFLSRFSHLAPPTWVFVAPVICATGELLLTSLANSPSGFVSRTACIFGAGEHREAYNKIVKPLDEIILNT